MWRLATQAPLVWSSCDLWMDVWWLRSFFFFSPNTAHCFDVTASCKSWKFGCNKSLKVMFSQIWLGIKCSINELPRPSRGHCSGILPPKVSYTVAGVACGTNIFLENWQFGAWVQVKDVVELWNKTSQRRPNFFRNMFTTHLKKKRKKEFSVNGNPSISGFSIYLLPAKYFHLCPLRSKTDVSSKRQFL